MSGNEKMMHGAGEIIYCSKCGSQVHFQGNQYKVYCGKCGALQTRCNDAIEHQAVGACGGEGFEASATESLNVTCPTCGGLYTLPETIETGQSFQCPYCNETFTWEDE